MSDSTTDHRQQAESLDAIGVAVLTISDTRTAETDHSGALTMTMLADAGFKTVCREVIKDEPALIADRIVALCARDDVDAILTNGGTGIAPRDNTFETINALLDRTLPGFGELFRMLSWEEVGAASMLSRAVAGLKERTLIFSMPGSRNAVELALRRLILPELKHLVLELRGRPS